ncbi:hypothetical protein LTR50_001359 [Elasticomyces elasticus]|nr:hypothetical protein LTR50_001359 [Elasticomyces elasticus]
MPPAANTKKPAHRNEASQTAGRNFLDHAINDALRQKPNDDRDARQGTISAAFAYSNHGHISTSPLAHTDNPMSIDRFPELTNIVSVTRPRGIKPASQTHGSTTSPLTELDYLMHTGTVGTLGHMETGISKHSPRAPSIELPDITLVAMIFIPICLLCALAFTLFVYWSQFPDSYFRWTLRSSKKLRRQRREYAMYHDPEEEEAHPGHSTTTTTAAAGPLPSPAIPHPEQHPIPHSPHLRKRNKKDLRLARSSEGLGIDFSGTGAQFQREEIELTPLNARDSFDEEAQTPRMSRPRYESPLQVLASPLSPGGEFVASRLRPLSSGYRSAGSDAASAARHPLSPSYQRGPATSTRSAHHDGDVLAAPQRKFRRGIPTPPFAPLVSAWFESLADRILELTFDRVGEDARGGLLVDARGGEREGWRGWRCWRG